MITIAEVIEEAAQEVRAECIGFADDDMQLNRIIAAIRTLKAKYEGCIVAEGERVMVMVGLREDLPLYRAKQLETCKPALQVERADARRPLTDEEIWDIAGNCLDSVAGRLQFARAIERAHKIGGNDD